MDKGLDVDFSMHFIFMISILLLAFMDYILFRDRPLYPFTRDDEKVGIGFLYMRKGAFYRMRLLEYATDILLKFS